jgi:hypothetical protein
MCRVVSCLIVAMLLLACAVIADDKAKRIDPAAWGNDHVGKPLPSYLTGGECLFCHRKIGPTWRDNRHQLTIRPAIPQEPAIRALSQLDNGEQIAAESRYLMGSKRIMRFVRRSKDYGKLDLLSANFVPQGGDAGYLQDTASPHWKTKTFADRCAGCHTTAVNTKTKAFSATSLDCFTCHGDVALAHTKDTSLVLFSKKNRSARHVTSTCGQCHLRGGKSKSTGLPYPNTFVAGDNLFRDFQVDFSTIEIVPPIDRHILINARDVAVFDRSNTSCLTCHDVHGQSSEKHQQLESTVICSSCHVAGTGNTKLRAGVRPADRRRIRSRVCDF